MAHYTERVLRAIATSANTRRRPGRVKEIPLATTIGRVLDISATGMRIESNRKRRGIMTITVYACTGQIEIPIEVMWSKRCGFRKHQIGVRFATADEHTLKRLRNMAFARWTMKRPAA